MKTFKTTNGGVNENNILQILKTTNWLFLTEMKRQKSILFIIDSSEDWFIVLSIKCLSIANH